ncbi:DedA family protein [Marinomonas pollencensis]|uniref:Membrane protein DedA with SNARE-associated domain n=1 Tax=Marinomonas pollencensis TaxID=491954 RepID=A0A3E0DBG9_9GAMM|nr:VTT domain-containing protein [Marinomonas pollencensis]REG79435.1 membrane protein DedA with SNARE-associated domain [Marinomonas pollencensis]
MINEFQQLISIEGSPIWLIMVGIIFLSYLLEDVAIVTAASLSAQEALAPSYALIAIMFGIISGDAGLYLLGVYAKKIRFLRYRIYHNKYFSPLRSRFQKGVFLNLCVIRFIPGLRTAGYTLSGFFSVSFRLFLTSAMLSTTLWVALVFSLIYQLGSSAWVQAAQYQWMLILVAAACLYAVNRIVRYSISRRLS